MMPPVELRNALIALRWSTDYLLKTVAQPHRTIVQVVNRVQKLRKTSGLEPTDRVEVYFKSLDEDPSVPALILKSQGYHRDILEHWAPPPPLGAFSYCYSFIV
ncbi:hypothetical protein Tco_1016973 [Tanacetum coccineum]|uniref:Ubiquitin-like domain-containing protein n=1 Tax=Tanacetum coccineum TaxID=301880 RepID=A0ABQ5FRI7_9ASTR